MLHTQQLALTDAFIPYSSAEGQHSGSVNPANRLSQGGKEGCSGG